jgi:hypothetical protein
MTPEEQKAADEKAAADKAKKEAEDKAADEAKKKKAKFEPEQVEFVNKLVADAFKDGAEKVEKDLQAKLAAEKAEREKLAKEIEDLKKTKEEKKEEKNPQLEAFQAQLAEMQGILGGIKTERDELKKKVETAELTARKSRKKDAFLIAAKEADVSFFDPLEAYELAEKSGYEWDKDTERPVVLNKETGRPKLNENGEPMTVIDFVKEFADKKKYLVKAPNQSGGTGSGEERKIGKEKKENELPNFETMTAAEFDAYTQKILNKR